MVSIETALLRTHLVFYPQSFSHLAYFNGCPCVANKLANANTQTHTKTNLFVLHRNNTNIMAFQKLCKPRENEQSGDIEISKFQKCFVRDKVYSLASITSINERAKEIATFHQITIVSMLERKKKRRRKRGR